MQISWPHYHHHQHHTHNHDDIFSCSIWIIFQATQVGFGSGSNNNGEVPALQYNNNSFVEVTAQSGENLLDYLQCEYNILTYIPSEGEGWSVDAPIYIHQEIP